MLDFGESEDGPRLTPKEIKKILSSDFKLYYTTQELNDKLYIHYKGYNKLENLEGFTGLKCLYGEANGFRKIEGLDHMKQLRCLYLHENCFHKIENLEGLERLHTLNLSQNFITRIEGLAECKELNTLHLVRNRIGAGGLSDVEHLKELKNLAVLDLSDNCIECPEILEEVLVHLPNLAVLYLKGNPVCKKIPNYRKNLIASIPSLKYLDDRPVFPDERRCAEAFIFKGGFEAERAERRLINEERETAHRRNHEAFQQLIDNARRNGARLVHASASTEAETSEDNASLSGASDSSANLSDLCMMD
eukprot:GDKJ01040753.1.p1 GENE.GDKJ01040753.1~~GDKJ01040753.1.p1  ORF type:complete len:305 (+),score=73.02 GDKJ01040753.1:37-951(+)